MVSVYRYRELVKNLVLKDLKLKYRDSVFGFIWSLANPLMLILVYSYVFGQVLRAGVERFPYFMMVGILPWNFFAQSLVMSAGSIVDNGGLIRKVALPLEVFPFATVVFNLAQYSLALIVFFPMALFFFDVPPSWSWLAFFPILFMHFLFTLGMSFVLAAATVFYRDVRHFTEIGLMLLFWLTPVVYEIGAVPDGLRSVVYLNPASYFIMPYQDVLYRGVFPSTENVLALTIITVFALAVGYTLFSFLKFRFAEEV
jgi:ABC-type polysaccharide/polyol phosphate export permease